MVARSLSRRLAIVIPLSVLGLLLGLYLLARTFGSWFDAPDPTSIAEASLQSMREQQRLIVFSSRSVATATATRSYGPLAYRRTLIMPGDIRYELNLANLRQQDLRWDVGTRTLSVTLPPIELSEPQIDINAIHVIDDGGIFRDLTGVDRVLEQTNRQDALRQLNEQARTPIPMRLARESAKRTVARSFALPLRAAGLEANVVVRFADEPAGEREYMDLSRPIEEVVNGAK